MESIFSLHRCQHTKWKYGFDFSNLYIVTQLKEVIDLSLLCLSRRGESQRRASLIKDHKQCLQEHIAIDRHA